MSNTILEMDDDISRTKPCNPSPTSFSPHIPSVNNIYIYGMMHTIVNQVNYEKGRNIYPNTAIPPHVKTPFLPTKKPPVPFHLKRRYLKCI